MKTVRLIHARYATLWAFLFLPLFCSAQFAIDLPALIRFFDSAIDEDGNSYFFGLYSPDNGLPFDFDPGPGERILPLTGTPFLASYTSSGELRFAFTLEDRSPMHYGDMSLVLPTIQLDAASNIYIASALTGWLDFDPGPDIHDLKTTSLNYKLGYVASYTSEGTFRFVTPLGVTTNAKIYMETGDSGNSYFTYSLQGKVDLDPGPGVFEIGEDNHYSYLIASLNANGGLRFAHAFLNEPGSNTNTGARIGLDDEENIYLSNLLFRYIDLDPGPNLVDLGADTLNQERFYIASYSSAGAFRFANLVCENFNLGILSVEYAFQVDKAGNSYFTGVMTGEINFDLVNTHKLSSFNPDLFLSSYDENGNFRFASTLGFPDQVSSNGSVANPQGICIDAQNRILITGNYTGLKDFDPGPQVSTIPSSDQFPGFIRTFVANYDTDGSLLQLYGFEGPAGSGGLHVSTNTSNQILVSGIFGDAAIDFDLGPGEFHLNPKITGLYATLLGDFGIVNTTASTTPDLPAVSISPNPFTESTSLQLSGLDNVPLRVEVVHSDGRIVDTLFEGIASADKLVLNWAPKSGMVSGVYFVRCVTSKGLILKPLIIIR